MTNNILNSYSLHTIFGYHTENDIDVYKLFQYHDMLKALRHSKQFDKMRNIMHALQGVKVLDHNNDRLKGFRQSKFEIIFTI